MDRGFALDHGRARAARQLPPWGYRHARRSPGRHLYRGLECAAVAWVGGIHDLLRARCDTGGDRGHYDSADRGRAVGSRRRQDGLTAGHCDAGRQWSAVTASVAIARFYGR